MVNVLIAGPDEPLRGKAVRLLKQLGCQVDVASSPSELFQAALGAERLHLVLLAVQNDVGTCLHVCSELRRRHLSDLHPQVVLHGPLTTPRQLLSAFEGGVNDWVGRLDHTLLEWHTAVGSYAASQQRHQHDILELLAQLSPSLEGVFKCTFGKLDARVDVRAGRICRVALTPNSRPLMRVVELEARRTLPEIGAWLRRSPQSSNNFRKALVDWGHFDRVRLRDALSNHARHALQLLSCSPQLAISFEPRKIDWSEELSFSPDEILPDCAPRSFFRPLSRITSRLPDNDVRMSSVS